MSSVRRTSGATTKAAGVGHKTIVIGGAYSVDKSTEEWLEQIDKKLDYRKWYAGHYHIEKKIDKLEIMFNNYGCLGE